MKRDFISNSRKIILLALIILLISCNKKNTKGKIYTHSFYALGTFCTIKAEQKNISDVKKIIFEEEKKFSSTRNDSIVIEINKNAGEKSVAVPTDVLEIIKKAKRLTYITDGYFNIMIGAVSRLYKDSSGLFSKSADQDEIKNIISQNLLNIDDLIIDEQAGTIFLKRVGEALDLGGIAKGYIIEKVFDYMISKNYNNFIINFGGDIKVHGNRVYSIGIQNPQKEHGEYDDKVELYNKSIVTSGAYERNFLENDKYYHHILNPFTGLPCEIINQSVSVIYSDTTVADALSTALFINPELSDKIYEIFEDIQIIYL